MVFKMTADNRACYGRPFAADRLAPKYNHQAHDEADVDVDDKAGHDAPRIANVIYQASEDLNEIHLCDNLRRPTLRERPKL